MARGAAGYSGCDIGQPVQVSSARALQTLAFVRVCKLTCALKLQENGLRFRGVMAMHQQPRSEDEDTRTYECGLCGACSSAPSAIADRYCVICGHSEIEFKAWLDELARTRRFEPDTASRAA